MLRLKALFALHSFGGGFVVQSLMALWLFERFGLDLAIAAAIFFWTGLLAAASMLAAPWLAKKVGLVNTMVFTHLPASISLILIPLMPSAGWVVALLLARSFFSQMDVPTRTSYVMAVVSPGERAAARASPRCRGVSPQRRVRLSRAPCSAPRLSAGRSLSAAC